MWAKLGVADGAGSDEHHVNSCPLSEDVGEQIADLRLHLSQWVGQLSGQPADGGVVLPVHHFLERIDVALQRLIGLGQVTIHRNELPLVFHDRIGVIVYDDVEAPDLIRAHSGLRDQYPIDLRRLIQNGVGVAPDDQIHTPFRIQQPGQLLVRLESDVG